MVKHIQTIRLSVFVHFLGLALKGLESKGINCAKFDIHDFRKHT